jgi:hypothetical protein
MFNNIKIFRIFKKQRKLHKIIRIFEQFKQRNLGREFECFYLQQQRRTIRNKFE